MLSGIPILPESRRLRDRRAPPSAVAGAPWHLQYVDNTATLGFPSRVVNDAKNAARRALDEAGLLTHENQDASEHVLLLGYAIEGSAGAIELAAGRSWRLEAALRHASQMRWVSGNLLEVLLGHTVFAFMLRRGALSVFSAAYVFVQKYGSQRPPLGFSTHRASNCSAVDSPSVC